MNPADRAYSGFALVREMMAVTDIVKSFDPQRAVPLAEKARQAGRILLAGEGSSRLFPAKNVIRKAATWGLRMPIMTDGCRQAAQYDLKDTAVFIASNSGRTREAVLLARRLAQSGNQRRYALSAHKGTALEAECNEAFILSCGSEQACAATKSVMEQALFYQSLAGHLAGRDTKKELRGLDAKLIQALTMPINPALVAKAAAAPTIYMAGYNDGLAEELALKVNEICRMKSRFLEGTFAVHGVEEVMDPQDVALVADPIEEEIEKFQSTLCKGVGMTVIAIADRPTPFPTIQVPQAGEMTPYLYLAAGWNLLVEMGLRLGINLDKPVRARKIGNEI